MKWTMEETTYERKLGGEDTSFEWCVLGTDDECFPGEEIGFGDGS